ncbi:hypothetical protein DEO23_14285 [Brachybacterium endophyticum]|uniref:Aminoglycoside phosphotransferase domain-containing protein n=1 Tax=Brachybacterium endophyticum TaxID=2182385 RepID=A0A2U2RHD8_9MICO|nr:phosphotransferase [Brachybacterium endophyticum]PWH05241.1 hypothetical protein DEO23_14285 [Brachybacterium endophyticum]
MTSRQAEPSAAQLRDLLVRVRPEPGAGREQMTALPRMRRLGRGWDNTLWHAGSLADGTRAVLRVPHREIARELLTREIAVLGDPRALPAALPFARPRLLGSLGAGEPGGPVALLTWVDGELVADRIAHDGADAQDLGGRLARSLAALHRPAPAGTARSGVRGVPLATRSEALAAEDEHLDPPTSRLIREIWTRGLDAPGWDGPDLLLHGDPHPGNLVIPSGPAGEAHGRAADEGLGLIDWGDVTAGDPASDVAAVLYLETSGVGIQEYLRHAPWARDAGQAQRDALVERARRGARGTPRRSSPTPRILMREGTALSRRAPAACWTGSRGPRHLLAGMQPSAGADLLSAAGRRRPRGRRER